MGDVVNVDTEAIRGPNVLKLGDVITLEPNIPVLLGRAGKTNIHGYEVYRIGGLENNEKVSNYGVKIELLPEGLGVLVISKPKGIQIGNKSYESSNFLGFNDSQGNKKEIKDKMESLLGGIKKIFVEDDVDDPKNGFILEMTGICKVKLLGVIKDGKIFTQKSLG